MTAVSDAKMKKSYHSKAVPAAEAVTTVRRPGPLPGCAAAGARHPFQFQDALASAPRPGMTRLFIPSGGRFQTCSEFKMGLVNHSFYPGLLRQSRLAVSVARAGECHASA